VSLLPTVEMNSERQELDTAERELHEEDCKEVKNVINMSRRPGGKISRILTDTLLRSMRSRR